VLLGPCRDLGGFFFFSFWVLLIVAKSLVTYVAISLWAEIFWGVVSSCLPSFVDGEIQALIIIRDFFCAVEVFLVCCCFL
jgi:hypothetical protein